jgi:hypothetical protein
MHQGIPTSCVFLEQKPSLIPRPQLTNPTPQATPLKIQK